MIKPADIVLTFVGAAVVGGGAWALSHPPPPKDDDDWGASAQVANGQSYPNNYYVPGAGYYHASYHAFFPFRYNFFDGSRGYYYGGSWWPVANVTTVSTSVPTPAAVAQARAASASARASSISRGGFGSTAHGSSSAS